MLPVIDSRHRFGKAWCINRKHWSVKLHDVSSWFNKKQTTKLQSCVACHFSLDGLFWISYWPPTITSDATWLSRGPQEGWSLSLQSLCGSSQWRWRPHSQPSWPHGGEEVINEVRYSSWWRWSSQQQSEALLPPLHATSPNSFTICAPSDPLPRAPLYVY